jgi:hypothetical protein
MIKLYTARKAIPAALFFKRGLRVHAGMLLIDALLAVALVTIFGGLASYYQMYSSQLYQEGILRFKAAEYAHALLEKSDMKIGTLDSDLSPALFTIEWETISTPLDNFILKTLTISWKGLRGTSETLTFYKGSMHEYH